MQLKMIKTLFIIIVVGIIIIAGWVVGVQTLKNSSKQSENPSKDVLIYALKKNGKAIFYKSALHKIDPKPFYILTGDEAKGFYMAWMEKDAITFQAVNPLQPEISEYFHLNLSGERSAVTIPQIIDRTIEGYPTSNLTRKAKSPDGKWSVNVESKDPESPSPDVKLIIQGVDKTIEIPITKFPHSFAFRSFFPQGFSSDNKFLYVIILETPGDIGAIGLYKINLDDENIDEIAYDENKSADYSFDHAASSVYLQPSTQYAYYVHGNRKILTQINTVTGEKSDIYSSLPEGYQLVFQPDEKTIIFNPPFDTGKAIQIFDIQTKTIKIMPIISGQFQAISSDKNYLVYSKYSEKPGDASSRNMDHINAMERKILITDYYILDVGTGKNHIIFTNKMVLSDSGSYVGLDGKEYSFVGLISSESK